MGLKPRRKPLTPAASANDLGITRMAGSKALGGHRDIAADTRRRVPGRSREPNGPFVARHWLKEPLRLTAGENRISFGLSSISDRQAKLGLNPEETARGQQNHDFRVWSMELVRPRALAAIQERARGLHSSDGWMVDTRRQPFFDPRCLAMMKAVRKAVQV